MKIELFKMERTQCLFENEVRFNLSESGVQPLRIAELLTSEKQRIEFQKLALGYPESTGRESLRRNIGAFYGCDDSNCVLVTNGGSEANYMTLWGLVGKADRVAFMLPNYMQGWGMARAYGRQADPYRLTMQRNPQGGFRWRLDIDSLNRAVTSRTRVVVVTNPNNPTGYVLDEDEVQAIVDAARRVGAWIVADEIYRGAEVGGGLTPTFWGRYPKVIVTGGLSKAFGLPGLRTGWVVAPPETIRRLCRYHDYLTLTPSRVSDYLADLVMRPRQRYRILKRTRTLIAENLAILEKWLKRHQDILDYAPPMAGAIATFRYRLPIASTALMNRLLAEQSVLITPGDHFGIGRYFRVGFGYDAGLTRNGLRHIDPVLEDLREQKVRR